MLYSEYTNRIKTVVAENRRRKEIFTKAQPLGTIGAISKDQPDWKKKQLTEQRNFSARAHFESTELMTVVTETPLGNAVLGIHPQFAHLKGSDLTENHWIISVFIDIKGSTNLFKDYDLEEIYMITNTIQAAEIHTVIALGGHIQRLQGDGILAYFGGRGMTKADAVRRALIACSFISYFVKNDLKDLFLQDGIEEISTRIGIDLGDDEDVLWANFGVDHISELTTLSLHTSLASKMQAKAEPNGIVAGDRIKKWMQQDEAFFSIISEKERYIFKDQSRGFLYTQWNFDWYGFLKKLPFILVDKGGSLSMIKPGAPTNAPAIGQKIEDFSGLAALASNNRPHYDEPAES